MYKGDLKPAEAYQRLQDSPNAWLVDVRTLPEWQFVGLPAVERLVRISWQEYPAMQVNENFVRAVEDAGVPKEAEILCICRSGARSAAAAAADRAPERQMHKTSASFGTPASSTSRTKSSLTCI